MDHAKAQTLEGALEAAVLKHHGLRTLRILKND